MLNHKTIKAAFDKMNRSGFYCLMTPVLPVKRKPETLFDFLGTVLVVSLSVMIIFMVRMILAN